MFTGESIRAERKNFDQISGSLTVKIGELIGIELYFAYLLMLFCLLIFHSVDE